MCVFVRLRISPLRIIIAASNFARWFIGVLSRESHILGNFAPPKAPQKDQNQTNRPAPDHARCPACALARGRGPCAGRFVQRAIATRRIGMCVYTAVPENRVLVLAMQCNAMTIMGTGASLYAHILLTITCTKTFQFIL